MSFYTRCMDNLLGNSPPPFGPDLWSPLQASFAEAVSHEGTKLEYQHGFIARDINDVAVVVRMDEDEVVRLVKIESRYPLLGNGGKALDRICTIADQFALTMTLMVYPTGDPSHPLYNYQRLGAWYRRRGFEGAGFFMERSPA